MDDRGKSARLNRGISFRKKVAGLDPPSASDGNVGNSDARLVTSPVTPGDSDSSKGVSVVGRTLTALGESKGMQSLKRSMSTRKTASQRLCEDRTLDTSETALEQRGMTLKKTVVREPLIYPAPYGSPEWAMDLLAVPHNAIRIEIQDLYKILTSLNKRSLDLLPRDFEAFFTWFEVFGVLFYRIWAAEEEVLFAWAEEQKSLEGKAIAKPTRRKTQEAASEKLESILGLKSDLMLSVEQPVVQKLFRLCDEFSGLTTDFFRECERIVPTQIMRQRDLGDKKHVEDKMIRAITKGYLEFNFVIARGIGADYLSFCKKYTPALQRINAVSHRKAFSDHTEIVTAFVSLQKDYEKTYRKGVIRTPNPSATTSNL
mmetsp:Transcript_10931/g.21831  ORF Transcript_10931/g.21831 Transcript_10931/m.21831 type:complete len:372 (-) Transcript_10931:329-1444(-)